MRDPKTVGHVFTEVTKGKLQVGRENFLPEEERMFRRMLERHGKAFAFSQQETGFKALYDSVLGIDDGVE